MPPMTTITATKIRRSWVLAAGAYVLPGKFKTEAAALEALAANPSFYQYWAGSIGASVANSTPKIVEA